MNHFDLKEHSHRRYNPLTGEWVHNSPHRAKRPWQGQVEKVSGDELVSYDAECYLCPGNKRANGEINSRYSQTYVFTNDYAALSNDVAEGYFADGELLIAKSEPGICKVICFSPHHNVTVAEMTTTQIRKVVDVWVDEYATLRKNENINYVQIFENKGSVMGCSNPHPHGQIWSQQSIPVEPAKKQFHQASYYAKKGITLLSDYLKLEQRYQERIIFENATFVVLVPFWAVWPFETIIIPKRAMPRITDMNDQERTDFADAYRRITARYDTMFSISFPYSAGIHQAPSNDQDYPEWHWHMVFYPPLLRSATVKKFMVGYEMLANPQRDITPEFSAECLRELSDVHYKQAR